MANEIQFNYSSAKTCYFLIRNSIGQVYNTSSLAFESYTTANFNAGRYNNSVSEQGSASGYYTGTFPANIGPGTYAITAKQQLGGSIAETDPSIAAGNVEWNGAALAPLSDTATSGQVGQNTPMRIYRGQQLLNFPFKLVSSADHVTPFTSGVCSGQISRDGGAFGALQSGAFTEIGLGFYKTNLTSGDLLGNTIAITFSSVGISGGTADSRDMVLITQRTSGQT
jgi:hypothetical protein